MPAAAADLVSRPTSPEPLTRLPFPPVTTSHILHCSYHFWHPLYRSLTPKARLIPLSPAFLTYLRSDGIVLPPETPSPHTTLDHDTDSGIFSSAEDDEASDSDAEDDPSHAWPEIHTAIRSTIAELGGSVVPKLNWSAPKDATWINAGNSMECRTPNDVYLLLKSSDFITHDLEQAFDGCVDDTSPTTTSSATPRTQSQTAPSTPPARDTIPYTLVLRKTIPSLNPACEFRCFARDRHLLCLCQRDLNHYAFLFPMISPLRRLMQTFFDDKLRDTFPEGSFVFDVYIPPPHRRVWLVDVNPWAPRTDPLLFSWLEVLTMERADGGGEGGVGRLRIGGVGGGDSLVGRGERGEEEDEDADEEEEALPFLPEVRLVKKDDPEAYSFTSPQYSAHKLPKDVVDASRGEFDGEGGLREFMGRWRDIVARQDAEDD